MIERIGFADYWLGKACEFECFVAVGGDEAGAFEFQMAGGLGVDGDCFAVLFGVIEDGVEGGL